MRIIIDTDPAMGSKGGDPEDSFAIMLALNSPEVSVEGVTIVQGNVPAHHGYANARHLLDLLGRSDVPLARGVADPIGPGRERQRRWLAKRSELEQLLPPVEPSPGDPHAVDFLIQTVLENPGEITLVTIGPLSNVALAILREPEVAKKAAGLVVMGGAAVVPGNVTPSAEFNVWADPEAAAVVFEAGIPLTMVGLDVCEKTHLELSTVEAVGQGASALARFVASAVMPYLEFRKRALGEADLHLYDSLAVAVAFRPDLVSCEPGWVVVETQGRHTQGATVTHLGLLLETSRHEPNAQVALEVRAAEFEAFFAERVIQPIIDAR